MMLSPVQNFDDRDEWRLLAEELSLVSERIMSQHIDMPVHHWR